MGTKPLLAVTLALSAVALPACRTPYGLLYHDVRLPLTKNHHSTPVGEKQSELDTKEIHDPFFSSVRIQWDSNAIGDISRRAGMEQIYYSDIQTCSYFFGVWTQKYVVLSGK